MIIETMARQFFEDDTGLSWDEADQTERLMYTALAHDYKALVEEAGHRIVPYEPTREMKEAALKCAEKWSDARDAKAAAWDALQAYKAMLDAAGGE